MFKRPPLQFVGNKFRFRDLFMEQVSKFKNPDYIFIDLFGGSGYLSHITKIVHPDNVVIYNDFDNYKERVEKVDITNALIKEIKNIFDSNGVEFGKRANKEISRSISDMLKMKEDEGVFVDWMTISSQVCNTNWICQSYNDMCGHRLYNRCHVKDIIGKDYFNGLTIIKDDWKNIYNKYKGNDNIVWILDPPYPLTSQTQYTANIAMKEVLNIIDIMFDEKHVIYFCSDTSGVEEIIGWKYDMKFLESYKRYERNSYAGGRAQKSYNDIMFVSKCL